MVARTRLKITFILVRTSYGLSSLVTKYARCTKRTIPKLPLPSLRLVSSGDVSVGTVARLRAMQPRESISIHERGDRRSIPQNLQSGSGPHPASYSTDTEYSFRSNKATGSVKLTAHFHLLLGLK